MDALIKKIMEQDPKDMASLEDAIKKALPEDIQKDEEKTAKVVGIIKGISLLSNSLKDDVKESVISEALEAIQKGDGDKFFHGLSLAKASNGLGDFLREQSKKKGLSNDQLAKAVGLPVDTIAKLMDGKIPGMAEKRMEGFAKALGVTVKQLMDLVPEDMRKAFEAPEAPTTDPKDDKNSKPGGDDMNAELKKTLDGFKAEIKKENDEKMEAITKENDVLKKEVAIEKDLRITKAFEIEAAQDFNHMGEKDKVVSMLKAAEAKMDKKDFEDWKTMMKSANKKLENTDLFKEMGSNQGADGTVQGKVDAKVIELRKSNDKLTKEQAEDQIMQDNPELYEDYLRANPSQL